LGVGRAPDQRPPRSLHAGRPRAPREHLPAARVALERRSRAGVGIAREAPQVASDSRRKAQGDDETRTMSLNDTIEKYFAAREAYDRAKAIATEAEKAMRRHEAKVIDAMLAEKQRSVRREDGTTVTLRKRVSFSSTADNRSAIRAWLIETEGSDHDFVE